MADFDEVIPPGQVGYVNLEILGAKVSGSFSKNATVHSNDPLHRTMTISLAGKILHYVDITPSDRVYLRGMYGEEVVKEIQISSNEKKKDFKIMGITSNIDDKITYKSIPTGEPGVYKIDLKVMPHFKYMGAFFELSLVSKLEPAS